MFKKIKIAIDTRGTVQSTANAQRLGIAGLPCRYRLEGTQIRTYVLKGNTWTGPYLLTAADIKAS